MAHEAETQAVYITLEGGAVPVRVGAAKALKRDGLFFAPAELRSTRGGKDVLNARADVLLKVHVEDHPLAYGDFEGTIPKGEYGGGTVLLWDRGFWAPEPGFEPEKALKKGELKFVLAGEKLNGSWVLVRLKRREGEKRDNATHQIGSN